MHIKDASPFDIVKEAWESLPKEKERGGRVYVAVDIEDGQIFSVYEPQGTTIPQQEHEETIFMLDAGSKTKFISDIITDKDILDEEDILKGKTRYHLSEEELHSCALEVLYEWSKEEIEEKIREILQKYPHLV